MFASSTFLLPYIASDKCLLLQDSLLNKIGGFNICHYQKATTESKQVWISLIELNIVLDFATDADAKAALSILITAVESLLPNCEIGGGSAGWGLDGNANGFIKTIGTKDNFDFPVITNNTEKARFTKTGQLGLGTSTPDASAILDITSTTKGVLFPRMTTAQRLAIVDPANGLIVYDTDLQDLMQNDYPPYDISPGDNEWVCFGAKGLLVQQDDIDELYVPAGYTYIAIGPMPELEDAVIDGTYVNITGNTNEILKFDATGYPAASNAEIDALGNLTTRGIALNVSNTAPVSSAILDITSTTKGVLISRMTTIQRLAIASPADGLLVYDTDISDLFQYDASIAIPEWVCFGAKGVTVQQDSLSDLFLAPGYTYFTFGNTLTLLSTSGLGNYVNIAGNIDEVLRFDVDGYPVTSSVLIHADGSINTPTINTTPIGAVTGDFWFEDIAGVTMLCRKNSLGVIQKVELTY